MCLVNQFIQVLFVCGIVYTEFFSTILGSLHSGYPLMAYAYDAHVYVNASHIQQYGDWGFVHEIGHNHQWETWSPDDLGEVTCNWWPIYVHQKVNNIIIEF